MHIGFEQDLEQAIESDEETTEESKWRVFIHNDNITPMDFVVGVLLKIFKVMLPEAEKIMLTAHFEEVAYVQTLPKAEAQKRVGKAHFAASLEGYPLTFSIEPE